MTVCMRLPSFKNTCSLRTDIDCRNNEHVSVAFTVTVLLF